MKIIIKNLKQVEYNIEVPSSEISVKDLKIEIEKIHGFDANQLKLLFNGIVLDDSKLLKEYNIKEESTIIMMNTKAKPKNIPPPNNPQSVPQANSGSVPNPEPKKEENKPKIEENKPKENKTEPNYTEQINSLLNMGCEKAKAEEVIKAAKGNLELAIDFYFNGIPEGIGNEMDLEQDENEGGDVDNPIKNIAGIAKILLQSDPNALTSLLESLGQTNPELMNLISENQEEFQRYLQQPITEDDMNAYRSFQHNLEGGEEDEEGDPEGIEGGHEHGHHQEGGISLTPEESEAVKRLKELGNFNEAEVVQAYFAFDKDEEKAANFLFEQKWRDDDEMFGAKRPNQGHQGGGQ